MNLAACNETFDWELFWAVLSSVGTIAAAGATLWAVLVALKSSRKALEHGEELQRRQWDRDEERRVANTSALSLAFDAELNLAERQVQHFRDSVDKALRRHQMKEFASNFGAAHMTPMLILELHADKLDGFTISDKARLLIRIATWRSMTITTKAILSGFTDETPGVLVHKVLASAYDKFLTEQAEIVVTRERLSKYYENAEPLRALRVRENATEAWASGLRRPEALDGSPLPSEHSAVPLSAPTPESPADGLR